jgi:hypothetical protein
LVGWTAQARDDCRIIFRHAGKASRLRGSMQGVVFAW